MADQWQLALLKRGVEEWNTWRKTHLEIMVNLCYADLSGADLVSVDIRYANLSNADLSRADLRKARLNCTDLRGADLTGANLTGYRFSGGPDLSDYGLPPKSTTPESQPSHSSSTTDWLSLVETYGANLLVWSATLASIIQGLDVVERRMRERQAKKKDQQEGATQNQLPSQTTEAPQPSEREITDILLVLDDGSDRALKQWVSDPDTLRAYIEIFTDPDSGVKPLQVVFNKRVGRALVVERRDKRDVHGKGSQEISNVILEYLDADPL